MTPPWSLSCGAGAAGLGVLGEYLGKIYMEVKHRPRFVFEETIGLEVESSVSLR